ncbi:long-chain acyl-CoA synthetase [Caballeronia udeis]|uniref:Long-chain acyl-CoA synthetase n=1 Tax=Caballeronia udeis TaxID=1232866 RepID=A0ABW8N3V7_9BURK
MNIVNKVRTGEGKSPTKKIFFFREGSLKSISHQRFDVTAEVLAERMHHAGLARGNKIGVLARNGLEWLLVDVAALKLGLVTAGFEFARFNDPAALIERYELRGFYSERGSSGMTGVDIGQLLQGLNLFSKQDQSAEAPVPPQGVGRMTKGSGMREWSGYERDDVTTIKFTSGSTGEPKGLGATAGSIDSSIRAVQTILSHGGDDNLLVFLPLSLLQQRYWVYSALVYEHDVTVVPMEFALAAAAAVEPTVIMGVPAFYEGLRKKIDGAGLEANDVQRRRACAESLLGTRIRYLWTGSAPAAPETLRSFDAIGMPLYEGYGMNETCIVSKNFPGAHRRGSVGKVLPNKRIRFDRNGVLIVGSEYPVNKSYTYCRDGDSERVFLPGGEVYTGDIGYQDEEGYLYIQGRADDILVLTSGRNVATRHIEEAIKGHKEVEECILIGSGRPYVTAVLSHISIGSSGNQGSARYQQESEERIRVYIDELNGTLPGEERVLRFFIAPVPFSVEGGTLTSQFKPKKREIAQLYSRDIDKMYGVCA